MSLPQLGVEQELCEQQPLSRAAFLRIFPPGTAAATAFAGSPVVDRRLSPRNEECAGGIPGGRKASARTGTTRGFRHRVCIAMRPVIPPRFQTRHPSAERTTPTAPDRRHHRIPATRQYSAGLHSDPASRQGFSALTAILGELLARRPSLAPGQPDKKQTPIFHQLRWAMAPSAILMARACRVSPFRRCLEKSQQE